MAEDNKDIDLHRELPMVPHEKITVGQTVSIPMGSSVLFGRGEGVVQGEEKLEKVYEVEGLENNSGVSRFGIRVTYGGEFQKVGVSRPHLTVDKRLYVPANRITVTDLRNNQIELFNQEYGLKSGEGIDRIFVGDEFVQNGFILKAVGNNQIRLIATVNQGKETIQKLH